jgi:hypothetical protein
MMVPGTGKVSMRLRRTSQHTATQSSAADPAWHRGRPADGPAAAIPSARLAGLRISAVVNYLDANDSRPGLCKLAPMKGRIPAGLPRSKQWEFWDAHVGRVFAANKILAGTMIGRTYLERSRHVVVLVRWGLAAVPVTC